MEELFIVNGWRGVLERSGRDFWRLQSALDAIFGVLGAPRGVWRPRDGILVRFGGSERLKMSHFGVRLGVRGPAEWGVASLINK